MVVFVFSALRYQTGYDYGNYLGIILQQGGEEKFEVLVRWLILVSRRTHYQVFFVITSFLTLFPIYRLSKKYSIDPSLSLVIYILFPVFFLESLSIIRNTVAFSLVALALDKYLERSYGKAILFYLVALGFHTSALVAILLVFLEKNKPSKEVIASIYFASFFVPPIILSVISLIQSDFSLFLKIYNYALNGHVGAGETMAILINVLGIACLIFWNKIENLNKHNKLWLIYCMVGVICWNSFGFEGTLRLRISSYFLIYLIMVIPYFKYMFRRIAPRVMKVALVVCLLCVFMTSFYININGHLKDLSKMSFLPYQTIFNRVEYLQYK